MKLNTAILRPEAGILATNKLLRNTYMLLSISNSHYDANRLKWQTDSPYETCL